MEGTSWGFILPSEEMLCPWYRYPSSVRTATNESLPAPQEDESERMCSRNNDSGTGARHTCGGPYKKAGPMQEETEFGCPGF